MPPKDGYTREATSMNLAKAFLTKQNKPLITSSLVVPNHKAMYAPHDCASCSCGALTPTSLVSLHPNIHGLCCNMEGHERNSS